MTKTTIRIALALWFAVAAAPAGLAATPPPLLNYQGVLRDASGAPVTGTVDMEFRFYDAYTDGNELLVDYHVVRVPGLGVVVQGGLFNAVLGGGMVEDGSGPGYYASLADVFRNQPVVYMSVRVGVETLAPRVRILAAAYALNASNFDGRDPSQFLDVSTAAQSKAGPVTIDTGSVPSSTAVTAIGAAQGGSFRTLGFAGQCIAGYGNTGVYGSGSYPGAGGLFVGSNGTLTSTVRAGFGDTGLLVQASILGAQFQGSASTAQVANANMGIVAWGTGAGGYFEDGDGWGKCYAGLGDIGVKGSGPYPGAGGWFEGSDEFGGSSRALVGYGGTGIQAQGTSYGGEFVDLNSSGYAQVGSGMYKIQGSGAVSFVQNHPYEPDRVLVYASPEGPEAATYTRGSGRLEGGIARLALDPTFALVTNPDIGLTAVATPRGEPVPLAIESLTTAELIVRGPAGSAAAFDYLVHGLRIGFEEMAIVQEKTREAPIPSMASHRERFARDPELRSFTALEHFRLTEAARGASTRGPRAFAAADALRAAIHEFDPTVDTVPGLASPQDGPPLAGERPSRPGAERDAGRPAAARSAGRAMGPAPAADERASAVAERPPTNLFPVAEPVEAGDLLALDRFAPGLLRRTETALDPLVVGVASGAAEERDGRLVVPLAETSFAVVKVDASFGAIAPGDLLAASPTRGHAMRAAEAPQGTVFAKALEPLEAGTGKIRVLVLNR